MEAARQVRAEWELKVFKLEEMARRREEDLSRLEAGEARRETGIRAQGGGGGGGAGGGGGGGGVGGGGGGGGDAGGRTPVVEMDVASPGPGYARSAKRKASAGGEFDPASVTTAEARQRLMVESAAVLNQLEYQISLFKAKADEADAAVKELGYQAGATFSATDRAREALSLVNRNWGEALAGTQRDDAALVEAESLLGALRSQGSGGGGGGGSGGGGGGSEAVRPVTLLLHNSTVEEHDTGQLRGGERHGWGHQEGRHRTLVACEVAQGVAARAGADACEFRDLSPRAPTIALDGAGGITSPGGVGGGREDMDSLESDVAVAIRHTHSKKYIKSLEDTATSLQGRGPGPFNR